MAKGFVHVNGVTYELAFEPSDDLLRRLAESLSVESGVTRIDVRVEGKPASLRVNRANVTTWAVGTDGPGAIVW